MSGPVVVDLVGPLAALETARALLRDSARQAAAHINMVLTELPESEALELRDELLPLIDPFTPLEQLQNKED